MCVDIKFIARSARQRAPAGRGGRYSGTHNGSWRRGARPATRARRRSPRASARPRARGSRPTNNSRSLSTERPSSAAAPRWERPPRARAETCHSCSPESDADSAVSPRLGRPWRYRIRHKMGCGAGAGVICVGSGAGPEPRAPATEHAARREADRGRAPSSITTQRERTERRRPCGMTRRTRLARAATGTGLDLQNSMPGRDEERRHVEVRPRAQPVRARPERRPERGAGARERDADDGARLQAIGRLDAPIGTRFRIP
jgi:hypothetical protein